MYIALETYYVFRNREELRGKKPMEVKKEDVKSVVYTELIDTMQEFPLSEGVEDEWVSFGHTLKVRVDWKPPYDNDVCGIVIQATSISKAAYKKLTEKAELRHAIVEEHDRKAMATLLLAEKVG